MTSVRYMDIKLTHEKILKGNKIKAFGIDNNHLDHQLIKNVQYVPILFEQLI